MPQENLTTSNTVLKGGKVRPKEDVTVYGTGNNKFIPAGKKVIVHRVQAEKLIEKGAVTKENPESASAEGKKGGKKNEE